MTYSEALAAGNKVGWSHASGRSMQAAHAQGISRQFCLRAEAVYNWLLAQYDDNYMAIPAVSQMDATTVQVAMFNDWSYAQAQEVLAGQEMLPTA